jgi:MFS family permease
MNDDVRSLRRDWKLFTTLTFLFSFGFAIYIGVFQNFLRDVQGAGPLQLGSLESIREIPGFLTAIMTGTLVALAESRVAGLGLLIAGIGVGLTGQMPTFAPLVAITVFWSIGFHLYASMAPVITLTLAKGQEGGRHLGRMGAVGSVATLAGLGTAWLMRWLMPSLPYNGYFFLAGACIFLSGLLCMALGKHSASTEPRARLILRREYGLFYLLTFLEGCRRQIFSIFASFALILVYHVPLSHMLTLQLINAVLIALTAPHIGKLVDRKGERGPLTFYSIGLIVVFLGYATTRTVEALYALFLLDNVLFSFGVGFTTYLNRIVRKGELTPCVAMGTTMNHIAAVTVPFGGAWLWERFHNYQIPFWVGVVIAAISLFATRWLPHGPVPQTRDSDKETLDAATTAPIAVTAAEPAA